MKPIPMPGGVTVVGSVATLQEAIVALVRCYAPNHEVVEDDTSLVVRRLPPGAPRPINPRMHEADGPSGGDDVLAMLRRATTEQRAEIRSLLGFVSTTLGPATVRSMSLQLDEDDDAPSDDPF